MLLHTRFGIPVGDWNRCQVEASTNQGADLQMPLYNLPSKILCCVINVLLKKDIICKKADQKLSLIDLPQLFGVSIAHQGFFHFSKREASTSSKEGSHSATPSDLYFKVSIGMPVCFLAMNKMLCKHEPKQEGTLSSLELQTVPVTEATYNRIQANGITGGRIEEMHADLPSKQELVPKQIYTNLTPDQIVSIKSYCHGSHKIGEGSFARVYRGILQGEILAIKEIGHRSSDIKICVENEVGLLQGKEHTNINKLCGWYIETNISYLAYMYIDGCTLDDYLRGKCIGFTYSWKQSLRMIMGIAKGIEFLHSNKIIHVDIKPRNIMVDANDNETKLVDFGFSRHVDWLGTYPSADKIIGKKGYCRAPQYCCNNKLSYKHDVYSFGIIVLEMITGQRNVDQARSFSQFHIPGYVRHMIDNNRFEKAVDTRLKQDGWDTFAVGEALAVANIALRCASASDERPDMNLVLIELTSLISSVHNNINLVRREEEIEITMSR